MIFRRVTAYPIWRSGPRPREIVTGIVEAVETKASAIAFVSAASAGLGAMRGSSGKVVRVKSALTWIGARILAGREPVSRLPGILSFIFHQAYSCSTSESLPGVVVLVKEVINAWSDKTSAGTSAAGASTRVATPGGLFPLLPPDGAASRLFVSCAYVIVLMRTSVAPAGAGCVEFRIGSFELSFSASRMAAMLFGNSPRTHLPFGGGRGIAVTAQ